MRRRGGFGCWEALASGSLCDRGHGTQSLYVPMKGKSVQPPGLLLGLSEKTHEDASTASGIQRCSLNGFTPSTPTLRKMDLVHLDSICDLILIPV